MRWKAATRTTEFVFDDKVYARVEDITPILKPRHDADPKYRAVIRGDENVPAEAISRVMNACGEAGISDIAFSALNKS